MLLEFDITDSTTIIISSEYFSNGYVNVCSWSCNEKPIYMQYTKEIHWHNNYFLQAIS